MNIINKNQNNVVLLKDGIENKKLKEAQDRFHVIVGSIDVKMQSAHWQVTAFDDEELEGLANFGETIKFPHDNTAVRALSILATYILKKEMKYCRGKNLIHKWQ